MVKTIRRTLALAALLLALMPGARAAEVEAALKNGDRFYEEHLEEALPASESQTFEVGYRVCWPEDAQTDLLFHSTPVKSCNML